MKAVAIAHPNIALCKYWGKQKAAGNYPAVPSLSMTLAGLATRTEIEIVDGDRDELVMGGGPADVKSLARAVELLDRVREASGSKKHVRVRTENDFPTSSGLASSASGFAALALGAARAFGLDWDDARISDLARQSSASAARSMFGGFVELEAPQATPGMFLPAKPVAPADFIDIRMVVCITTDKAKETPSTEGMLRTAEKSPYFTAWLEAAPRIFSECKAALLAKDIAKLGDLVEQSSFAMHACAMAAGVLYANAGTLEALAAVRELRRAGKSAWATMDAGPHVKVLTMARDAEAVAAVMGAQGGVLRVIVAKPGPAPVVEVG